MITIIVEVLKMGYGDSNEQKTYDDKAYSVLGNSA
jgi:hypothetical protein